MTTAFFSGAQTGAVTISSVVTSPANSFTELSQAPQGTFPPPQCFYAGSASTSTSMSLTATGPNSTNPVSFVIYDIVGAAPAPFDNATYNFTDSSTPSGNFTLGTITPTTSNGLIIAVMSVNTGFLTASVGSGQLFDTVTYGNVQSADTIDNVDGYSHVYNQTTAAVTFGWTLGGGPSPTLNTAVAAFKAAA